jgi:hypothetical protein
VLCVRRVVFGVCPGPPSSHSFFPGRSPLEFRVLGSWSSFSFVARCSTGVLSVGVCVSWCLGLGLLEKKMSHLSSTD